MPTTPERGTEQVSILGTPHSVSGDPYWSNFYTFQVQGQLSPNFVSVTHGSFLRNWWAWQRTAPTPLVQGTTAALQVAGEGVGSSNSLGKLLADPININTQQARGRIWDGHDWYIAEDATWVHSGHTISFGGSGTIWHDFHLRTDNVLGGLTSGPIYYIGARGQSQNSYLQISSAYRPPTCGGAVTTNCLLQGDVRRWTGLYAAILGMIDHSSQIQTRDGDFNPNPLGTPLYDQVTIPSFTTYFQDVWKATRNLTITWGVALTPSERKGKEVVLTYADSHAPFSFVQYLQDRAAALGAGQPGCFQAAGGSGPCYNPKWGLIPVRHLSHPFHDKSRITDWRDLGRRAAVAWQVPVKNWLFGAHQTVIRGGYALVFDRTSAVNQVLTPLLTGGLADADVCAGPQRPDQGGGCIGRSTDPIKAYRIGVDGSGPGVPPPTKQAIPFIPSAPLGLFLSFPLDPYVTPGYAHSIDFTVQRALPHNMFLELGYIGRFSRNLAQSQQLTAAYYLMKDPFSGQTYAQAFDAVAQQLRAGVNPANVTPQPFFEDLIGPQTLTINNTPTTVSGTVYEAFNDPGDLFNGDLGSFAEFEANFDAPLFVDNMQILEFAGVTSQGYSNYNAGFLVFRKAFSHGLQFQADWTWSHAIGNQGFNQQYVYSSNSPYDLNIDRASEVFDRRHVFTFLWYYDLPFGT